MTGPAPVGQPGQQQQQQQGQPWQGAPPAVPPQQQNQQPAAQPVQHQDTPAYQFQNLPPAPGQQQGQPQQPPGQQQPSLPQIAQQMERQQQPLSPQILGQRIEPGPGIPPELVGRTYGEAMNIYAVMRQEYLDRQQNGRGPQPQQQQQQPVQQVPAPQAQAESNFWLDPAGTIERIVDSRVERIQAPQRIQQVQQTVLAGQPHVQELQQGIQQYTQGLPPEQLANPATWDMAYKLAYADAQLAGRLNQAAPQPQMPVQQQAPQGWQPYNAAGQFFTEQPMGGNQLYGAAQQVAPGAHNNYGLTEKQVDAAKKMNMTLEDYAAWSGGYRPQGG